MNGCRGGRLGRTAPPQMLVLSLFTSAFSSAENLIRYRQAGQLRCFSMDNDEATQPHLPPLQCTSLLLNTNPPLVICHSHLVVLDLWDAHVCVRWCMHVRVCLFGRIFLSQTMFRPKTKDKMNIYALSH